LNRVLIVGLAGSALVAGSTVPAALSSVAPAGADSIATLHQQATALATEIQTDYAKLQVLDEGYNQAQQRVSQLKSQIASATKGIAHQAQILTSDQARLRNVAIAAYVTGGSDPGLSLLFNGDSRQVAMKQAYLSAASGNLGQAEAAVTNAQHQLTIRKSSLQGSEKKAAAAESQIANERSIAQHVTAQLESDLSSVKGRLAQAVAAAERQRQLQAIAAAQAAALARQQAIAAAAPAPTPAPAPAPNPAPVQGGGSGSGAVQAAESQLGVPYVWGGATPGVGFDCSGLTMWAWGQAGVGLAHGATDQYYQIAHVSMSALQPGDLIFYGDSSYLYHVVMYVGSGPYGSQTVIQAQNTGTNVMYTPIPPGAYGAGRP
jgi:cell wall-associated NlpC family hydrolase